MAVSIHELVQCAENITKLAETQWNKSIDNFGRWEAAERFKNIKLFSGAQGEWEEFSAKVMSQVAAGSYKVEQVMKEVERMPEELVQDEDWEDVVGNPAVEATEQEVKEMNTKIYSVLMNLTTGEANAAVRRCRGNGLWAWKRMCSSLNPRTLASGVKRISDVLVPGKIHNASKADQAIDSWEDKLGRLDVEYGEELSNKMKVAVLYSMLPKDLQEKALDKCGVNWDSTDEHKAGEIYERVKQEVKNIARSRREMVVPKPMEVDRVWNEVDVSSWGPGAWDDEHDNDHEHRHDHNHEHEDLNDSYVQYVGKGVRKGSGKGFQRHCYLCGEFGHSQYDCLKGKGKGKGVMKGKGYVDKWDAGKGHGKDNEYGKGYKGNVHGGSGFRGKGGDWYGQGVMRKACFVCGSTEHLARDCPKNQNRVQSVEDETPEVLFIGNVQEQVEEWRKVPMKVKLGDFVKNPTKQKEEPAIMTNMFKVLEVNDEDDEEPDDVEVMNIRTITARREVKGNVKMPESGEQGDEVPNKKKAKDRSIGGGDGERETKNLVEHFCEDVQFVQAVRDEMEWLDLGKGDIIIDSAADESCWPAGQGDAFPTIPSRRKLVLKTANGGDMTHYGQKEVIFKCGGTGWEPMGLTFQVTDGGSRS